ncbi:MAG: response regulator [Candidatus Delongbacteria bacterium]
MSKKNILVIEDDENISELIEESLSEYYSVIKAETGEQGIEKAISRNVSAVILDIKLPGISGWEVVRNFRKNPDIRNIPVIFLTAVSEMEIQQQAANSIVIKKPFDPEELLGTVNNVAGKNNEE